MPIFSKLELWLAGALALVVTILAVLVYIHFLQGQVVTANRRSDTNHAAAVVAGGQVAAGQAAGQTLDQAAQRDAATVSTHMGNAHAIAATPGADARLDPRLNAVGRRGLCKFDAYAGAAACVGLRGPDPAVLPPGHPGNLAPGR